MRLIPAIDLKNNLVVHARGGERHNYRPLATPLFPQADPLDVVKRLNTRYGCQTFYLADLDAIAGIKENDKTIASIIKSFPNFTYWIDAGIRKQTDYQRLTATHDCVPVLASETLTETDLISTLTRRKTNYILTLDFKNHLFLGSKKIIHLSEHWPATVIALSLNAVGNNGGPDYEALEKVRQYSGKRRVGIGGGVRDMNDLARLCEAKVDTALVATALYTNQLTIPINKNT